MAAQCALNLLLRKSSGSIVCLESFAKEVAAQCALNLLLRKWQHSVP